MKAVMISIQPKWCELIANGKKTIEVRKTKPNIETPFKCYIYCTEIKDKKRYLDEFDIPMNTRKWCGNGKVIGEFICDKITKINGFDKNLEKCTCMSVGEAYAYAKGKSLYLWHISQLEIYDTPKELSEFYSAKVCRDYYGGYSGCDDICGIAENNECRCGHIQLKKPPQSWCYCEELEENEK